MFFLIGLSAASVFSGNHIALILCRQQMQVVRMMKKTTPSTDPKIIGSLLKGPTGAGLFLFRERHCKII
jgi:hypothetical protein